MPSTAWRPLSDVGIRSQIMSRLVWEYEGANVEKHGEQCVFVGDKVHHDILGEGIAVRIDGGMIIIEFLAQVPPLVRAFWVCCCWQRERPESRTVEERLRERED